MVFPCQTKNVVRINCVSLNHIFELHNLSIRIFNCLFTVKLQLLTVYLQLKMAKDHQ